MKIILGVDPGIANTGLAVVSYDGFKFTLLESETIKTDPEQSEPIRLLTIFQRTNELLETHRMAGAVAVEKVFHNKNISSSISTGKVMGVISLVSTLHQRDYLEFTPQQVKRASGLGHDAEKKNIKRVAEGIVRTKLKTHHEADAILCAISGHLHLRSKL